MHCVCSNKFVVSDTRIDHYIVPADFSLQQNQMRNLSRALHRNHLYLVRVAIYSWFPINSKKAKTPRGLHRKQSSQASIKNLELWATTHKCITSLVLLYVNSAIALIAEVKSTYMNMILIFMVINYKSLEPKYLTSYDS